MYMKVSKYLLDVFSMWFKCQYILTKKKETKDKINTSVYMIRSTVVLIQQYKSLYFEKIRN